MHQTNKIQILGVEIDRPTKAEFLLELESILEQPDRQNKIIATTYSEFIVEAESNLEFKQLLNRADYNLADGIGVLWAASFLNRKTGDLFDTLREFLLSAWQTAFAQEKIQDVIPEKISGADLIWDLAALAEKTESSVFLLGGYGPVDQALKTRYPDLKIAGRYEGSAGEIGLADKIRQAGADILMVAFGPVRQEQWLDRHKSLLNVKLAIGLGGSFDYVLRTKQRASQAWQAHGLEWLHRLITQPHRWRRMWNAIIVFTWLVVKDKLNAK